jgi:hypothetical protein
MLRMWALRFREKLLVCVEDCLEKGGARLMPGHFLRQASLPTGFYD